MRHIDMSPHRTVKARKLLSKLMDPQVMQVVDRDKLTSTAAFAEMIDMAVAHALDNGDVHYVNQLVDALAGARQQRLLSDRFCSRLGLKSTQRAGHLRLKRDPEVQIAWQPLETVFLTAVRKRDAELAAQSHAEKVARLPVVLVRETDDMLDSRKRLPGSFGAGKRR